MRDNILVFADQKDFSTTRCELTCNSLIQFHNEVLYFPEILIWELRIFLEKLNNFEIKTSWKLINNSSLKFVSREKSGEDEGKGGLENCD